MTTIQTVLLVDDEPDIRVIGEMALTEIGGWKVWTASSGAQALELAEQKCPDLILLDVMMPSMDGPATLARLRGTEALAEIPVIFLTAKAQKHEIARYLELGARGVVTKPFDPLTLADDLRALLGSDT